MKTLINRAEACEFFGQINPSTLYRQIRKGLLPAPVKVGGSSRWLLEECREALQGMVEARS
jgi:predicted DNA-binding transcriptional regulator AlpA